MWEETVSLIVDFLILLKQQINAQQSAQYLIVHDIFFARRYPGELETTYL